MPEVRSYSEMLAFVTDPRDFPAGTVIFQEGDAAHEMFVVREGTVSMRRGGQELESLGPGAVFGEMALVDPAPRSATALAGPGCRLVVIDEPTFNQLVQKVPGFALELLRLVIRRLRRELARG
jgi:CRP/FNR family transcriptional regulator, cyclic AMP receptor protein